MADLDDWLRETETSLTFTPKQLSPLHRMLSDLVVTSKVSALLGAKLNKNLKDNLVAGQQAWQSTVDDRLANVDGDIAQFKASIGGLSAVQLEVLDLRTQVTQLGADVAALQNAAAGGGVVAPAPDSSTNTKELSNEQLICLRALHAFESIYLDSQLEEGNSKKELARMKQAQQNSLVAKAAELMVKSSSALWRQLHDPDENPQTESNRSAKLRVIHELRNAVLSDNFLSKGTAT
jgi:hypothetical protein